MEIALTVNEEAVRADVEDRTLLVYFLREQLALTGTKIGCDTSSCGACTVLLDGQSVKSCTVLAAQADGTRVTTIEGLADGDNLHPVQLAFREHHGLQCGYCTPGMVLATVSLLAELDEVTEEAIRVGLEGNLCRCTGYHNIVKAVLAAAGADRVIPVPFTYLRPASLEEALGHLSEDEDAKILAGGHSLLPIMKLRLAMPTALVDIGRISGLSFIEERDGELAVGSMTRHFELVTSSLVQDRVPLLAHAAAEVGDPQVRHRGTIGGSVVHGDPASDLPAAVLALGGRLLLTGPGGTREVRAEEFFLGFLETAIEPDEILTEIRLPFAPGAGFEKFTRRAQDWAIVGVAVSRRGNNVGVALVNMGSTPLRALATEQALASGASVSEAADLAAEGTEPTSDLAASSEYRQHLARVLVRRALEHAGI